MREQAGSAFNSIGFRQLCEAKKLWAGGDEQQARTNLLEARATIAKALEYRPENAIILGNKGYIEFLLGAEQAALATLSQAIKLGGEKVREGELKDSEIHPLPQDEEFRQLVLSISAAEDIFR